MGVPLSKAPEGPFQDCPVFPIINPHVQYRDAADEAYAAMVDSYYRPEDATGIYIALWNTVVNKMQLAEAFQTGESGGDSDGDGIPFNPATVIAFTTPREAHVRLAVYDLRGRVVGRLVDGDLPAGRHEFPFRGDDLASGIYHYVLNVGDVQKVGKMALLK